MSADSSSLRPGAVLTTLWAIIAFVGSQFAVGLIAARFFGWDGAGNNASFFIVQGIAQLVCLAILYKVITHYKIGLAGVGLKHSPLPHLGRIVMVYLAYLGGSAILAGIAKILFGIDLEQAQDIGFTSPQGFELLLTFIALVIITPFVEELIFRGFLYRAYGKQFGPVLGALLVSVLFALVHGQVNVGIDVFVMSLAGCYLRQKTDSLWSPILLHALKNFIAFIALFALSTS